jgi:periplasmic protein TonB
MPENTHFSVYSVTLFYYSILPNNCLGVQEPNLAEAGEGSAFPLGPTAAGKSFTGLKNRRCPSLHDSDEEIAAVTKTLGNLAGAAVSKGSEDARTSHPCESGAGLLKATSGDWCREKLPRNSQGYFRRCVMAPATDRQDSGVFLDACLLEGDSEKEKRARHIKQRAILVSIVLQIVIVAALLLMPLLGKSENIAARIFTPTVPFARAGQPHPTPRPASPTPQACNFCAPHPISPIIVTHDSAQPNTTNLTEGSDIPGLPSSGDIVGGNPLVSSKISPLPPPSEMPAKPRKVSQSVQAAMLVRRVEPLYPPLPRQMGREGRVELHAIISTSGTIESLEVVSGDPLFYQSALAAVREWRYRPTILDGQPVEVDTQITVIYTLAH